MIHPAIMPQHLTLQQASAATGAPAELLAAVLRPSDGVSRRGGAEFLIPLAAVPSLANRAARSWATRTLGNHGLTLGTRSA